ncbi:MULTISPECIES: winged helix-turn-helix transcriptional regulator [Micrococcales]|uniref:winged helix-turn-helix transcriptional regulator n=1 Tax=Micrococcales TaxID=85006 RepID=UPI001C8DF84A|nr:MULTISPECIES: helix-turn-helix domain-containing protein [Micrococcales]MBY0174524.1 helix-turn-helix transcriptional regulator [Micrococcus luteus]MCS6710573.1 helix-turn-helix transcriptional regulator [Brachybacterium sillae]MCV7455026.1 helix-turn-helix transcriptional regulator [Micrococcus luteus]MCV7525808.1 helix-turn-helix transcriptional regulator [Micrococcus luteus]UWF76747.1 helix-turn-helix transcriptional regulator [Microbacterium neungamense]
MVTERSWNPLLATCPSRTSLARIANKWTALIVIALQHRRLRFGELQAAVDGISKKVLVDTLRDLERDGIVERIDHGTVPRHVDYGLTPLGSTLEHPLGALVDWAAEHFDDVLEARQAYDEKALGTPHG